MVTAYGSFCSGGRTICHSIGGVNMARKKKIQDKVKSLRGFVHIHLVDGDGALAGDSGWVENTIVNEGFDDFMCRLLANTTSSKQIRYVALGTGTAPAATSTSLPGEIYSDSESAVKRTTFTVSVSGSKTLRLTATFNSTSSHNYQAETIQNIGLYDSNTSDHSLFAGVTYNTSQWNTNQSVNVTYDIAFS